MWYNRKKRGVNFENNFKKINFITGSFNYDDFGNKLCKTYRQKY